MWEDAAGGAYWWAICQMVATNLQQQITSPSSTSNKTILPAYGVRCILKTLDNFWMMRRLKAISFYEGTRSGMKALMLVPQHRLLISPSDVNWAHLSFKLAAFILELGSISIQSCKGEVRRVCSRHTSVHTNGLLSLNLNEKRLLCVWSPNQSLHAFAIDWLDESKYWQTPAKPLHISNVNASIKLLNSPKKCTLGILILRRDVMQSCLKNVDHSHM